MANYRKRLNLSGAPTETRLDESRWFFTRLTRARRQGSVVVNGGPTVGVVMAFVMFEFYGGRVSTSTSKDVPIFIGRLAARVLEVTKLTADV